MGIDMKKRGLKKIVIAVLVSGMLLLSSCGKGAESSLSSDGSAPEDIVYNVKDGVAVPKAAKSDKLYVYSLGTDSTEAKKAAYALQGLISQQEAEVYLMTDGFPQDQEWLEELKGEYSEVIDVKIEEETGFLQLFKDYKDRVKKILVYDPSREKDYTWNVAMTLGSLEGGLPMPNGLLRIVQDKVGYDGEVVDLTNKWASKEEAYDYLIEELLPKTNKQVMFCLDPQQALRHADYAMAARCTTFWLNETKSADLKILNKIFGSGHFNENAIIMGYGDASDGKSGDNLLVASNPYGIGFLCSDWFGNGTVFSSIESVEMPKQPAGKAAPIELGKTYVCMFWSDGDNIQYDQIALKKAWNNPNRGKIPVASTVAPLLTEIAPTIMKWYRANMTENDELMAGPSGWQFIYCSRYEEELLKSWSDKNKYWMERAGMTVANMWLFDPRTDKQACETILTRSGLDAVFTPNVALTFSKAYDEYGTLIFNAPGNLWNTKKGELYDQVLSNFIAKPDEAKFVTVNNIQEGSINKGTYDVLIQEVELVQELKPDTYVFLRPSDFVATYREYMKTQE